MPSSPTFAPAFRYAADQGDLVTAAALAAHTAMLTWPLQRFEPVGWAEEILAAATAADLRQLPRLYTAASICTYTGRPAAAVGYAQTAVAMETDARHESFETGWSSMLEAVAHLYTGRIDRWLEVCAGLRGAPGVRSVVGLAAELFALPAVGRADEAAAIAEETVTAARAHGNPFWIAFALAGYGRAFTRDDPPRALAALREGLEYSRDNGMPFWEALIARDAAGLEAVHGELEQALALFDTTIDAYHRAGNVANLAPTLTNLAVLFDRLERPAIAATLFGTSTNFTSVISVVDLPSVLSHLRTTLGETALDDCVATGAAMDLSERVHYARHQIELARRQLTRPAQPRSVVPPSRP